jgi:hypothetical protein
VGGLSHDGRALMNEIGGIKEVEGLALPFYHVKP